VARLVGDQLQQHQAQFVRVEYATASAASLAVLVAPAAPTMAAETVPSELTLAATVPAAAMLVGPVPPVPMVTPFVVAEKLITH